MKRHMNWNTDHQPLAVSRRLTSPYRFANQAFKAKTQGSFIRQHLFRSEGEPYNRWNIGDVKEDFGRADICGELFYSFCHCRTAFLFHHSPDSVRSVHRVVCFQGHCGFVVKWIGWVLQPRFTVDSQRIENKHRIREVRRAFTVIQWTKHKKCQRFESQHRRSLWWQTATCCRMTRYHMWPTETLCHSRFQGHGYYSHSGSGSQ